MALSNCTLLKKTALVLCLLTGLFAQSIFSQNCTNWLHTPSITSKVSIGDLDITGDQITIEAIFYSTSPVNGSLVTKQNNSADVNYLLNPNDAYITTTNGLAVTPTICAFELNKTYHVAMVYDGNTLKFYRNGFLMSQTIASGDLIQNSLSTTFGEDEEPANNANSQFIGYINEVRIWSVARTQTEIQTYMNTSLPNPTLQTGLQAYYTFDNLVNKQGNTAWNGTLIGAATINSTVSNCVFVADSCFIPSSPCNNWLQIPNSQSYVTVGDMDVAGTEITVEGLFARDSAFTPEGFTSLNVVSKHWTPADVNYLLRVDRAQITTTNGHFMTPEICELTNKKLYHAAMTYDGTTLKFYRNGFLMSQVPCTGDMIQNDYATTIAATANSPTTNTQLIGYLNEIRIWNVAKTQAEIQQYINIPLPNPGIQTGLVGYYTFEDLTNKQGNSLYDAILNGNASINERIPNCNFQKDSCARISTTAISGIINNYAAVATIDFCNNKITVDDAAAFNAGDTVVIMQMKGAAIDSSNTISFGTITNYNNAGSYEFNYVKSKTGNSIEFEFTFLEQYDAARGKVQLIRVPYYQFVTIAQTLTCPAWDGAKGGVVVVNSAAEVNMDAGIDVSNKGFRGGAVGGGFSCGNVSDWGMPVGAGGTKGEGITEYIAGSEAGGARLANGGGAAYAANSGGGGGGNFGAGGLGGLHSNTCPSPTQSINGEALDYSTNKKIFLGGGGGGGQEDNQQPVAAGGNGGGIVMIKAATLNCNNRVIAANGETVNTLVRDEGGAGGGAGGSVILFVNGYAGNLIIEATGGNGTANENQIYPTRCHGPGGGGGGGFVGASVAVLPTFINPLLTGGRAGVVLNTASACYNTTNGATDGNSGGTVFNLVIPEASVPFKKNIDSVRIKDSITSCKSFDFKGLAYVNTNPIQNWQWSFDDGSIDNTQNTTHTYNSYGPHPLKLVITDMNGCKDSATKIVNTNGLNFDFTFEQDACNPLSVKFKAIGGTTPEIFWSLGDGTIINNTRNPVHVYADTGSYLVQYSTGNSSTGCIDTLQKIIFIGYRNANIVLTPDTGICFGGSKLLRSNIDTALQFCWSPNSFLNNVNSANPTTNTPTTITYTLLATSEESNLISNGNFTSGNSGFTTDYDLGSTPLSTAEYIVTTSSLNAGPFTSDCKDHTTGSGNMMVVRNNFSTSAQIWGQSVPVLRNTNYMLSAWVQSLAQPNNAQLQFLINGNVALDNITAATSTSTCTWTKHFIIWNTGNNTTANLSIFNKPTTAVADDYFAIDDISFSLYAVKRDSVKVTVDTPFVNTRTDTSVCESVAVQLNTFGAATYSWTPATGLSNAAIASPMATPTVSTKYFVTGTSTFGCAAIDSVTISIKPKPVVTSTGDTTICRNTAADLFAAGGVSYSWSPAALFNNPNIANPVAIPTIVNTKYVVAVTGANNCISKDSFMVNVKALPVFSLSPDKSVCLNDKAQLTASGGEYYLWSPASSVSNANISNPLAIATVTTPYSVLIRDTLCGYDTTLFTNIIVLPVPTIAASKENDINCAIGSAQLTATGALQYNWTPAASLNDATSPAPIASPANTTTYTVRGTDGDGCSNTATITVLADFSNRVTYSMPNAFTPNGDDKNDCFRIKYFGLVQEIQLTIFNRFGEKVFFTTDPNDCWDGTFKGAICDQGNFVYYLKAKTTCGNVERKGNVVLIR